MLSNGAVIRVVREACVFGIGTLMGLKMGAILGFQPLSLIFSQGHLGSVSNMVAATVFLSVLSLTGQLKVGEIVA